MPDWLSESLVAGDWMTPLSVSVPRLVIALMFGLMVAMIYRYSLGKGQQSTLPTTLVLLSVLIALVTMVIGNNVARAFGLVGALSIVRFRTIVDDTRDTAFVIFAVVVGMAVGAGYAVLAAMGIPAVAAAMTAMYGWEAWSNYLVVERSRRANGDEGSLSATNAQVETPVQVQVRIGLGHDPELIVSPNLRLFGRLPRLTGATTVRQGAAIELHYQMLLEDPAAMASLVAALNRIEGIQGVDVRT